jgi:hypothetical protein
MDPRIQWQNATILRSREYTCGYCSRTVGPDKGFLGAYEGGNIQVQIFVCSSCGKPSFFDHNGAQFPGQKFGNTVAHLPKEIQQLYEEARAAMASQAYTPAVLACRKILMSVAVANGAAPGDTFANYVKYLADTGYIPPNGKHWVDHIRTKSNEANHEIVLMTKDEAEKLIVLTTMMLTFIYELPNVVPVPTVTASP